MYELTGLQQIQPLAEIQWKVSNAYRTIIQEWEGLQPKLIDLGVAIAGVALMATVAAYNTGVWSGRLYRRLNAALRGGIESFRDAWIMHERHEYTLPHPAEFFGTEYLPVASTFAEFVKLCTEQDSQSKLIPDPQRVVELELLNTLISSCQDEPTKANPNEPIALPAPNLPNEDPFGMDDFDSPIPGLQPEDWESAEVVEDPTVPDLNAEVTQQDVTDTRKRRGRPRKSQGNG